MWVVFYNFFIGSLLIFYYPLYGCPWTIWETFPNVSLYGLYGLGHQECNLMNSGLYDLVRSESSGWTYHPLGNPIMTHLWCDSHRSYQGSTSVTKPRNPLRNPPMYFTFPLLPSPLPRGLVNYLCKWVSTSVVWVSIFEENIQSWVFHILIFFGNLHGYDSILFFTLVAVIGYRVLKLLKWMWFWAWLEFRVMILRKSTYIKKKINYIKIKAHILYTPKK
jgi:hypothetical protein